MMNNLLLLAVGDWGWRLAVGCWRLLLAIGVWLLDVLLLNVSY
jgi:hypothetical protein